MRPASLLLVPLVLLSRVPPLLSLLLSILPVRWPAGERGRAFRLAVGNLVLLRHDRPRHAWSWMQRVLAAGKCSTEEYFLAAVCLYQGLGRLREATALFARANEMNAGTVDASAAAAAPYRVLDDIWARHIGDTAILDYVIKEGMLEGRGRDDFVLFAPPKGRIGNRFLLTQLAQRLRVVERPDDLPFPAAALAGLNHHYQFPRQADGSTAFFWERGSRAQQRWQAAGREPLLKLPPDIAVRGRALLQAAGVPRDAWFVAWHVRDIRWRGLTAGMQAIRNADPLAYLPALAEIAGRGGFVVRIGDADAPPLPALANVVDYCRSDFRADWMDIFLLARSRFVLGSASGPSFVPPLYGVPTLLTNWWPPGMRPWHAADIFLPKLPRRVASGRYLTLSETLNEPFSHCHSPRYLAEQDGVAVEDNDPELIRAAVVEMLARLDGEHRADPTATDLRARADAIYQAHGHFGAAALAAEFLRRHANFIA